MLDKDQQQNTGILEDQNIPTLQEQLDDLWADLENNYGPSITAKDEAMLTKLDAQLCDGELTQAELTAAKNRLMDGGNRLRQYRMDGSDNHQYSRAYAHRPGDLFGDFELLINRYLDGNREIKDAVCKADWEQRGFSSLKYHLDMLPDKSFRDDHVYKVCASEGPNPTVDYLRELEEEVERALPELGLPKGIYKERNMYRVDMTRDGQRYQESFKTRSEAVDRRRVLLRELGYAKS